MEHVFFSKKVSRLRLTVSFIVLSSFLGLHIAEAVDYTSSNFTVRNPLFGIGGSQDATSTNFQVTGIAGQTAPGEGTSTGFTTESGFEYFDGFEVRSQNWRWYDDENNETPTSDLALENVAPSDIANNNIIKLRLTLNDQTGVAGTDTKIKLQFSEYSDFSQNVSDVAESWNCTGNSFWCYGDGVDTDNDSITTILLSDATATGTHNEAGTSTTNFDIPGGESTEMEFTIKSDGPRVNTTYYFRAYNASTSEVVALGEGESYPSLSTGGSNLAFTIGGLELGTTTEGVATDAATTPTAVPFGELSFSAETAAAQRLEVSTNATEGYQIFVFERQGLIDSSGDQIDPITGTNASPGSWAATCPGSQTSCYGYHTGDDTLSGGSARFAADNTFAQFENTPQEIGYSAIPTDGDIIDMVYKIQVEDSQEAGLYESNIAYIIVPVF